LIVIRNPWTPFSSLTTLVREDVHPHRLNGLVEFKRTSPATSGLYLIMSKSNRCCFLARENTGDRILSADALDSKTFQLRLPKKASEGDR
jgi:hypothetical protein